MNQLGLFDFSDLGYTRSFGETWKKTLSKKEALPVIRKESRHKSFVVMDIHEIDDCWLEVSIYGGREGDYK